MTASAAESEGRRTMQNGDYDSQNGGNKMVEIFRLRVLI